MNAPMLDRAAWLQELLSYLGVTDIAAIAGKHKYKTALDVYLEKTGTKKDDEAGRKAQAGLALEPLVRQWAALEIGKPIVDGWTIIDPEHSFLGSNPDGGIGEDELVEIKTVDFSTRDQWGEPNTDQIPIHYFYQVVWYLGMSGRSQCTVIRCDRGTMEIEYYRVEADAGVYALMRKLAVKFWTENVLAKVPPDPEGRDGDNIIHLFPTTTGEVLIADDKADEIAAEMAENRATVKPLDKRYEELKSQMKVAIGSGYAIETMSGKFTLARVQGSPKWAVIAKALNPTQELIDANRGDGYTQLKTPF